MKKIIQYRVREVYGNRLEYVVNPTDAHTLQHLTGKKTISAPIRELVTLLTDGLVTFEQTM